MGLFGKKEKSGENQIPQLPQLPKLPDLPKLPEFSEEDDSGIHQLPSFPSSPIGKKFSQDSIKDAVSGEKRGMYANDFPEDEEMGVGMMQSISKKPMTEEVEDEIDEEFPEKNLKMKSDMSIKSNVGTGIGFRQETEPVFVRIDRFEEGLRTFEDIKNQISDIEHVLSQTKSLKEKEEAELASWEAELKRMKEEVEKIGRDIFSKI